MQRRADEAGLVRSARARWEAGAAVGDGVAVGVAVGATTAGRAYGSRVFHGTNTSWPWSGTGTVPTSRSVPDQPTAYCAVGSTDGSHKGVPAMVRRSPVRGSSTNDWGVSTAGSPGSATYVLPTIRDPAHDANDEA